MALFYDYNIPSATSGHFLHVLWLVPMHWTSIQPIHCHTPSGQKASSSHSAASVDNLGSCPYSGKNGDSNVEYCSDALPSVGLP